MLTDVTKHALPFTVAPFAAPPPFLEPRFIAIYASKFSKLTRQAEVLVPVTSADVRFESPSDFAQLMRTDAGIMSQTVMTVPFSSFPVHYLPELGRFRLRTV
jgi:hypothetical protein